MPAKTTEEKHLWSSRHYVFHWQNWFGDNKGNWDPANDHISRDKETVLARGVDQLHYNPKVETSFKRYYKITVDVWNFNRFWQYTCVIWVASS